MQPRPSIFHSYHHHHHRPSTSQFSHFHIPRLYTRPAHTTTRPVPVITRRRGVCARARSRFFFLLCTRAAFPRAHTWLFLRKSCRAARAMDIIAVRMYAHGIKAVRERERERAKRIIGSSMDFPWCDFIILSLARSWAWVYMHGFTIAQKKSVVGWIIGYRSLFAVSSLPPPLDFRERKYVYTCERVCVCEDCDGNILILREFFF